MNNLRSQGEAEQNSLSSNDPLARFKEMIRIANSRPCPSCKHSDVASDGLCAATVPLIDKEPQGSKRCRCPCVNFVDETIEETIRRGIVLCPRCNSILLVDTKGDVAQCAMCGDNAFVFWNLFVQAK